MFTPKIQVEIIHKNLDLSKKKCKIKENKVIIEKGSRGRGKIAWTPSFTKESILEVKESFLKFFTKTRKRLMILEGAEECLEFHDDGSLDLNGLNRQTLEQLINMEVIKRSGEVTIRHEFSIVFWLLLALTAGGLILQIMQMRGVYL